MVEEEEDDSVEQLKFLDERKRDAGKQLKLLDEKAQDSNELLHFKLRLTPEMHEKLKILAVQNKRTMSHEIVARLEGSFESPPALPPALLERLRKRAGVRNRPAGKLLIDIVEDAVGMMEFQDETQYREAEANLDELSDDEFRSVMNTITIIRDKRGNADKTIKKTNSSNKAKKQT